MQKGTTGYANLEALAPRYSLYENSIIILLNLIELVKVKITLYNWTKNVLAQHKENQEKVSLDTRKTPLCNVINVIRTLPNDERLAGSESHASTSTNLLLSSASLTTGEGVDSVAEFFEKLLQSPLMLDTLGEEGLLS